MILITTKIKIKSTLTLLLFCLFFWMGLPVNQSFGLGLRVHDATAQNRRPVITSISPSTGSSAGGTVITITGLRFNVASTVFVSGNAATSVHFIDSTQITATIPASIPASSIGNAPIVVFNPNGLSGNITGVFTYFLPPFATGGTEADNAGYRIHTFTTSGTFTVNRNGNIEYLVVAGGGGGGGGGSGGGGGGAGGLQYSASTAITIGTHTITVGAGGVFTANGANSSIGTLITATGGGAGGAAAGATGGSGGGGSGWSGAAGAGIAGQGNNGGTGGPASDFFGAGGGGAGAIGSNGTSSSGGNGGAGKSYSISGTSRVYAGGGGGAGMWANYTKAPSGSGGAGGGGNGYGYSDATPGLPNTGGGGGAWSAAGSGGSGIVIIRYPIGQ